MVKTKEKSKLEIFLKNTTILACALIPIIYEAYQNTKSINVEEKPPYVMSRIYVK